MSAQLRAVLLSDIAEMDLIRLALRRPMAVFAAVLIVVVLGLAAMQAIPIQLTLDVRQPVLEVTTQWPRAAPIEITNRLEEELTGLEGLVVMTSSSDLGRSRVTLEFATGANMDRAFMLVSNRLNAISDLPDGRREPEAAD